MYVLINFIQNITLIAIIFLFILSAIKIFKSFKDLRENKPEKHIKTYYIENIGGILSFPLSLSLLYFLMMVFI